MNGQNISSCNKIHFSWVSSEKKSMSKTGTRINFMEFYNSSLDKWDQGKTSSCPSARNKIISCKYVSLFRILRESCSMPEAEDGTAIQVPITWDRTNKQANRNESLPSSTFLHHGEDNSLTRHIHYICISLTLPCAKLLDVHLHTAKNLFLYLAKHPTLTNKCFISNLD